MITVIQIPTPDGQTVNVTADPDGGGLPYRWACEAGDAASESPYTALPFARRDAQAHANTCHSA
ncbi:hypothetical protein AB0C88_37650 [Streptomyces chartreusis]|uniref:hypothetical protein n=1 Tax=Streptomyces chartreusis TaxID=1969 RepID=UPI0033CE9723